MLDRWARRPPKEAVQDELASLLGPVRTLSTVRRGYTHNVRLVAVLEDGRSVFVKRAVDDTTARWLRQEHHLYDGLAGRPFLPEVLGWVDGERPGRDWRALLDDPTPLLALGLCDARWVHDAGPVLHDAAASAPLAGDSLLHCDVRSDNVCVRNGAAVLVDWNLAAVGHPRFDAAFWLPSLAAEGGPHPESVLPDCPAGLAAFVAGFFAYRAGLPELPHAPQVRAVQRRQLATALPWAARALGLTPPVPPG